jgi:hypothetical protein
MASFESEINDYLDKQNSEDASNFYKEYEVLILGYSKILKEFQNLKEGNLFSETKREELKRHISYLHQLDFKLKRIVSRTFSQKYNSQLNELIDFAKTQMLLSQSQATLSELEQLLNEDEKEVKKVASKKDEEDIENKDRLHEITLRNLENQRQREKREHEHNMRQLEEQFKEKRIKQEKLFEENKLKQEANFKEELKELIKQKAQIEMQRQELELEIKQLKKELAHFQDLQDTKFNLENNEKIKEFRKTTFIDSVVNDWIEAFHMDIKFRTKSIDFYDELFRKTSYAIKDIFNIPSNYGTTINSQSEQVLPLNFFVELESLYLERVNLCFLPSLILPKLQTLIIQDCFKGVSLTNGRYGGVKYKFDLTDDWIKAFQRNNPKCRITITT